MLESLKYVSIRYQSQQLLYWHQIDDGHFVMAFYSQRSEYFDYM